MKINRKEKGDGARHCEKNLILSISYSFLSNQKEAFLLSLPF